MATNTGHAFVKATMREAGSIYGGKFSAHHYFRDFNYCDSGMIPWLMVWQLLSEKNVSLSEIISDRKTRFPSSGELNFVVSDPENCLKKIKNVFSQDMISMNELDGLTMTFKKWRFNLRNSKTEPLVRLNVEARGDKLLLSKKTEQLCDLIKKL